MIKNFSNNQIYNDTYTFLASNFVFNENLYIIQVTTIGTIIYDQTMNIILKFNFESTPIITKFKKKRGFLYIYNKNKSLIRYNIHHICNLNLLNLNSKHLSEF